MKNILQAILFTTFLIAQSCGNEVTPAAGSAESVLVTADGTVIKNLSIHAWKGSGNGRISQDNKSVSESPVYLMEGGHEKDSQTVIWIENPDIKLEQGKNYIISTKIISEGIVDHGEFYAALRGGGLKDISEKFQSTGAWQELRLFLTPKEDVAPKYLAIRLYGPGRVSTIPFVVKEVTTAELEAQKKEQQKFDNKLSVERQEKVMRPYAPTLPLPNSLSLRQFRIWGTVEPGYPALPFGWTRVPMSVTTPNQLEGYSVPKGGYLPFKKDICEPIYLETVPKRSEIISEISGFAAPGEYEPLTFALYAAKDIEGMKTEVSDLKGGGGQVISRQNIDIRTVNFVRKMKDKSVNTYYLAPMTLTKGPDFIESETSRRYWLTIYVPPKTAPGKYTGVVTIKPANAPALTLPVTFRVLPFQLLDPPTVRFMWSPIKPGFPKNNEAMFQDMAEHGFTSMMAQGDIKTRDRKVGPEDVDNIRAALDRQLGFYQTAGFRDPPVGGIYSHQITYYWDSKLNWFKFWPITPELDAEYLRTYRSVFLDDTKGARWPGFYHYVIDEPGGTYPKNIEPAAHYAKLLKKEFPTLKTFATIGGGMKQGYDEVGLLSPYLDVSCTNYVTRDVIDRLDKLNSQLWIYNGSSHGYNPVKERFFFGWYAWKIGARGIGQWTYSWNGSPFSQPFRDGRQDYAFETKDGFLPTVGWECIREGIDDLKYIYTLSQIIHWGLNSPKRIVVQNAKAAEQDLNRIMNRININYLRGTDVPESNIVGVTPDDLSTFRWTIAEHIINILSASNSTWSSVKNELATRKYVANRPSADDWKLAKDVEPTGKDLLAATRIGGLTSSWKFEVWRGAGSVSIDNDVRHNGKPTIKLEVTSSDRDDNVVSILHKSGVTLKKGKKYRLSTWLKTEKARGYVSIYAAIRSGGIKDLTSSKVSGSIDWQQSWIDFVPEEDVKPEYIAVRLWGNGTAWADRVTLQEL